MKRISIIIPCYNEEQGILNLASQLNPAVEELKKKYEVELIFVDDGSTDKTNDLLHDYFKNKEKIKIIKHKQNKNLGAALRTGFAYATGDYIAALDSDCTYSPKLIQEMLNIIDDADIVTVSPYHPNGTVNNVPGWRIFLSKSVSRIYRTILGFELYTYTAMVRVYRKEVIDNVKFESDTFLGVTEIMVKSLLRGYKAKELPAELNVRKFGASKIKIASVILNHLNMISKILLHRLFKTKL